MHRARRPSSSPPSDYRAQRAELPRPHRTRLSESYVEAVVGFQMVAVDCRVHADLLIATR
eukprot:15448980-Alexandrium_andersonii.AAC.1